MAALDAENARRRRTRAGIKRAFRELALESEPDKLTVSSLAERALISRKTFYLYYDSIEALYFEEQQELLDRFFAEVEETPEDLEDFSGHAMRFFTFLAQQDDYLVRLVCAKTRYGFGERLYEQQMRHYERAGNPFAWMGDEQDLIIRFVRSTALEFFRNWVETGKRVARPPGAPDPERLELAALCQPHGGRIRRSDDLRRLGEGNYPRPVLCRVPRVKFAHGLLRFPVL